MSDSATLWTVACQAPLSMRFPRQKHWSELPFPPPGDLPDPGINPTSPAMVGGFFTTELPVAIIYIYIFKYINPKGFKTVSPVLVSQATELSHLV